MEESLSGQFGLDVYRVEHGNDVPLEGNSYSAFVVSDRAAVRSDTSTSLEGKPDSEEGSTSSLKRKQSALAKGKDVPDIGTVPSGEKPPVGPSKRAKLSSEATSRGSDRVKRGSGKIKHRSGKSKDKGKKKVGGRSTFEMTISTSLGGGETMRTLKLSKPAIKFTQEECLAFFHSMCGTEEGEHYSDATEEQQM